MGQEGEFWIDSHTYSTQLTFDKSTQSLHWKKDNISRNDSGCVHIEEWNHISTSYQISKSTQDGSKTQMLDMKLWNFWNKI